jgi:myosin heavy subunit
MFKVEQQEYLKEKLDWSYINFNDNQECLDLIEKKPLGILSLLDEECRFPKSSPKSLALKLKQNHVKSKCVCPAISFHTRTTAHAHAPPHTPHTRRNLVNRYFKSDPRQSENSFVIHHYAGSVGYDTTFFLGT